MPYDLDYVLCLQITTESTKGWTFSVFAEWNWIFNLKHCLHSMKWFSSTYWLFPMRFYQKSFTSYLHSSGLVTKVTKYKYQQEAKVLQPSNELFAAKVQRAIWSISSAIVCCDLFAFQKLINCSERRVNCKHHLFSVIALKWHVFTPDHLWNRTHISLPLKTLRFLSGEESRLCNGITAGCELKKNRNKSMPWNRTTREKKEPFLNRQHLFACFMANFTLNKGKACKRISSIHSF